MHRLLYTSHCNRLSIQRDLPLHREKLYFATQINTSSLYNIYNLHSTQPMYSNSSFLTLTASPLSDRNVIVYPNNLLYLFIPSVETLNTPMTSPTVGFKAVGNLVVCSVWYINQLGFAKKGFWLLGLLFVLLSI